MCLRVLGSISGDCHLGNLGPLADKRGRVAVVIRDLDQSVIGNPAHDLIRLALSLASAARGSNLPGVTTARLVERLMVEHEDCGWRVLDRLAAEKGCAWLRSAACWAVRAPLAAPRRRAARHGETHGAARAEVLAARAQRAAGARRAFRWRGDPRHDHPVAVARRRRPGQPGRRGLLDEGGCSLTSGACAMPAMLRVGEGDSSSLCLLDVKEGVSAAAPRRCTQTCRATTPFAW